MSKIIFNKSKLTLDATVADLNAAVVVLEFVNTFDVYSCLSGEGFSVVDDNGKTLKSYSKYKTVYGLDGNKLYLSSDKSKRAAGVFKNTLEEKIAELESKIAKINTKLGIK